MVVAIGGDEGGGGAQAPMTLAATTAKAASPVEVRILPRRCNGRTATPGRGPQGRGMLWSHAFVLHVAKRTGLDEAGTSAAMSESGGAAPPQ